jgi:hypothetical protein
MLKVDFTKIGFLPNVYQNQNVSTKIVFLLLKTFFFIKIDFITNLDCIYLELIFWD